MGRPPSNGGPAFRFTSSEVSEMEVILQQHNNSVPAKEVVTALAEKFSESEERRGKITVQMKQVWNWFQNKRYAIMARSSKAPGKLNITPMHREDSGPVRTIHPSMTIPTHATSVPNTGRVGPENSIQEFEAKSGRDGAWYDVASFLSHRHLETGDPEVLVRFGGFGPEEDEWINVRKHLPRQRVLMVGGGGAVGFAAIQLAVAADCHVTTTCGSESVTRLLEAGAEQAVDYISEDMEAAIKGKFDAVLDTIGIPDTERIGINFLKRGGHYMTLQGEAASLADKYGLAFGLPASTGILLKKQLQYQYSHGIEYHCTYMRADLEALMEIRKLCDAQKLKIPVEKTFPITQVIEAHVAKERNIIPGKVVLEVD